MANYQLEQTGAEVQALLNAVESPDTTPAAGSSNLITSGAVQAAVAGVSAEVTALGQKVGENSAKIDNAGDDKITIIPAEGDIFSPQSTYTTYLVTENYKNKTASPQIFDHVTTHLKGTNAKLYVILTSTEIAGGQCVNDFSDEIIWQSLDFTNTGLAEIDLGQVYTIAPGSTLLIVAISSNKCTYTRWDTANDPTLGYPGFISNNSSANESTTWGKVVNEYRCVPPVLYLSNNLASIAQVNQKLGFVTPGVITPPEGAGVFVRSVGYTQIILGQTYRNKTANSQRFNVLRMGIRCRNTDAVVRLFKVPATSWATNRYIDEACSNYELIYEGAYFNDGGYDVNDYAIYLNDIVTLLPNESVFAVVFSTNNQNIQLPLSNVGSLDGSTGYFTAYKSTTYPYTYQDIHLAFGKNEYCCVPPTLELVNIFASKKEFDLNVRKKIQINATDTETVILQKMIDAITIGDCDVFFEKSTYTLSEVYIYMRDTLKWTWHMGLPIGGGCRYYLNGSTIISNAPVEEYTDSRNTFDTRQTGNLEMYDGRIVCNGGTYCIHDEMGGFDDPYNHKYINIIFEYSGGATYPFGCGTNYKARLEFDGCVFLTNTAGAIHGPNPNAGAVSLELVIKNCYFQRAPINASSLLDKDRDNLVLVYCGNSSVTDIVADFNEVTKYNNEDR